MILRKNHSYIIRRFIRRFATGFSYTKTYQKSWSSLKGNHAHLGGPTPPSAWSSSIYRWDFPSRKPSSYWATPYIPIAIGVAAAVDDEDEEHLEPGSTDGLGAAIVKKSQSSRATTIILYIYMAISDTSQFLAYIPMHSPTFPAPQIISADS